MSVVYKFFLRLMFGGPARKTVTLTAREYYRRFGAIPMQFDLERVNCVKAGDPGHQGCGVCAGCGAPRWLCPAAGKLKHDCLADIIRRDLEAIKTDEKKPSNHERALAALVFLFSFSLNACASIGSAVGGTLLAAKEAATTARTTARAVAAIEQTVLNVDFETEPVSAPTSTAAQDPKLCPSVCFSPGGHCDAAVAAALDVATFTVDAAVYSVSASLIVDALIRAAIRGVHIRLAVDRVQAAGAGMKMQLSRMRQAGVEIRHNKHSGFMHEKAAVIDGALLIAGSFNWTGRASKINDENLLTLCDVGLVAAHATRFKLIWEEGEVW